MIIKRVFGLTLILAAAAAFIFSAFSLYELWHIKPAVTQKVTDVLTLFDQTLSITQDGLVVVGQGVQTTRTDVGSLQTGIQALAQTLHETGPMLDSLTSVTSKALPAVINSTQSSLAAAQNSAQIIDNLLLTVTSLPFLPLAPYKPDVPLHTALSQVSSSLNSLPSALDSINTSLNDGKANLGILEEQLNSMSETTQGIGNSLDNAQAIIDHYKSVNTQLKAQVETAQSNAANWITIAAWILSFLLVWLLIAQLGLGMLGMEMLLGRPLFKDSGSKEKGKEI